MSVFEDRDLFSLVAEYFAPADWKRARLVCRSWNAEYKARRDARLEFIRDCTYRARIDQIIFGIHELLGGGFHWTDEELRYAARYSAEYLADECVFRDYAVPRSIHRALSTAWISSATRRGEYYLVKELNNRGARGARDWIEYRNAGHRVRCPKRVRDPQAHREFMYEAIKSRACVDPYRACAECLDVMFACGANMQGLLAEAARRRDEQMLERWAHEPKRLRHKFPRVADRAQYEFLASRVPELRRPPSKAELAQLPDEVPIKPPFREFRI